MSDSANYPVRIDEMDKVLTVTVSSTDNVTVGMETSIQILNPSRTYDGAYDVIPKADEETILETEGLVMADDVTVRRIPYFETSNISGKTVYIASEV